MVEKNIRNLKPVPHLRLSVLHKYPYPYSRLRKYQYSYSRLAGESQHPVNSILHPGAVLAIASIPPIRIHLVYGL